MAETGLAQPLLHVCAPASNLEQAEGMPREEHLIPFVAEIVPSIDLAAGACPSASAPARLTGPLSACKISNLGLNGTTLHDDRSIGIIPANNAMCRRLMLPRLTAWHHLCAAC